MRKQRRGTIYLITLGTAMIVTVLGMAAMLTVRVQRGQIDDVADSSRARFYARAAIDMALFRIEHDPDWRQEMKDGTWEADQTIGTGSYSFQATDPLDGNLTDSRYDPVVIVGTGKCGRARQRIEVRLKIIQPGMRCLEAAMHCNTQLFFDAVTASSDHFVSSNKNLVADHAAQVYADVEAAAKIEAKGESVFHGSSTTEGDWPREMPDPATVFNYYTTNGTQIDVNDLSQWDDELLDNPNMDDGTTGWTPSGECTLAPDADVSDAPWSIRADNRSAVTDGPSQDVTDKIQSGETYHARVEAKWLDGVSEANLRISLRIESSGSGVQYFSTSWTAIQSGDFDLLEGGLTPTWTGSLIDAKWVVESESETTGFKIDRAAFYLAEAESGWYVIHRKVLSPATNPFGTGTTNSDGIYVIDCAGAKLSIKDSRIVGTLILLDPNSESIIEGSISWEPAVVSSDPLVSNLPALMVNKDLNVSFDSTDLDEGTVNANFNPAGTPHAGSEDADRDDSYPSLLNGVVYTSKKFTLANHPTMEGVVVSQTDIIVNGSDLDVTYDPIYYETNAPPGFRADPVIEIVPGSFRQVVD